MEREQCRFRRSSRGAEGSTIGQCRGVADGSLKWLLPSRFELLLFLVCCLDFATSHRIFFTVKVIIKFPALGRLHYGPIQLGASQESGKLRDSLICKSPYISDLLLLASLHSSYTSFKALHPPSPIMCLDIYRTPGLLLDRGCSLALGSFRKQVFHKARR